MAGTKDNRYMYVQAMMYVHIHGMCMAEKPYLAFREMKHLMVCDERNVY